MREREIGRSGSLCSLYLAQRAARGAIFALKERMARGPLFAIKNLKNLKNFKNFKNLKNFKKRNPRTSPGHPTTPGLGVPYSMRERELGRPGSLCSLYLEQRAAILSFKVKIEPRAALCSK